MLTDLNPKGGVENWINQMLVKTIEDSLKKQLNTETVNYFFVECDGRPGSCNGKHKVVWFGKGLIPFIRKCLLRRPKTFALYATSSKCKSGIRQSWQVVFENGQTWGPPGNTVDLGDMHSGGECSGDRIFDKLVERIRKKAAKQLYLDGHGYYWP